MIPASSAWQRPDDSRLLVVDEQGRILHDDRARLDRHLRPGDLLVANDAATIPASLAGTHRPTGRPIEVRLAGRRSLEGAAVGAFTAVVFGAGDHRTRTEHRPAPPALDPGDRLELGPLEAVVERRLGHPRLVELRFLAGPDEVWEGLGRHGRPIQYAHLAVPLGLWDVWTAVAARPAAFEPPSAGFALDWKLLGALRARGVAFATLTHAAGISSTGDPDLDRRLPLDEAYTVPEATALAVARARERGGRVVALGTTVARALEHAAAGADRPQPGPGLATGRLGHGTLLRIVDAIVTGVHARGDSHHELLRAFADDLLLARVDAELELHGYRSHEFGDSVLLSRQAGKARNAPAVAAPRRCSSAGPRAGASS
jgi:S-adenosylmethionine:tRNA ribosyltransferase-isomerase